MRGLPDSSTVLRPTMQRCGATSPVAVVRPLCGCILVPGVSEHNLTTCEFRSLAARDALATE